MRVRVLQTIMVGSSALSTSFAQQYHSRSSNSMCSIADQSICCEMMLGRLEEARHFCFEHGCNQNICSGKPSGIGYDDDNTWRVGVKKEKDEDHDNDVDLWVSGSGGTTQWQWGKDEDDYDYDGWVVDKLSKDKFDRAASASAILPSRQRQKQQQRRIAWSPPAWGAPTYTEPKTYYPPPAYYYYPPPAAPKFVETCCTSGEKVCPMEFPMEKQVLLSGTVRVCCFTSRVDGGGGYYPHSYGGGGYQTRTRPRYGGGSYGYGYGNRKLQYGYEGGRIYGQQPSYYRDSYGFPAQCPTPQNIPVPTPMPTTPAPPAPSPKPSVLPTTLPSSKPSMSLSPSQSSKPSLSSKPSRSLEPSLSSIPSVRPSGFFTAPLPKPRKQRKLDNIQNKIKSYYGYDGHLQRVAKQAKQPTLETVGE